MHSLEDGQNAALPKQEQEELVRQTGQKQDTTEHQKVQHPTKSL